MAAVYVFVEDVTHVRFFMQGPPHGKNCVARFGSSLRKRWVGWVRVCLMIIFLKLAHLLEAMSATTDPNVFVKKNLTKRNMTIDAKSTDKWNHPFCWGYNLSLSY